ncbi:MAG: hypothetical protein JWN79_659 [Gemmatimonadetes bacterium]|jgi:hypothetical protein|nr:hypothetical protein [Gemmatimonadota bacterium]
MRRPPRFTLEHNWPAAAAGAAALLGMGSCAVTIMPLMAIGAPLVGVPIALLAFRLLLGRSPIPGSMREEDRQLRVAARVAWGVSLLTCIAVGLFIGDMIKGALGGEDTGDGGVLSLAVLSGLFLGWIIAAQVERIGHTYFARRRVELGTPLAHVAPED